MKRRRGEKMKRAKIYRISKGSFSFSPFPLLPFSKRQR
jgi:hypothetical protein